MVDESRRHSLTFWPARGWRTQSGGNYRRKAIWECGETQSSETRLPRTGETLTFRIGLRPWGTCVSQKGIAVAVTERVDACVADFAATPAPSLP